MIKTREEREKEVVEFLLTRFLHATDHDLRPEVEKILNTPQLAIGQQYFIIVSENDEVGPYGGDPSGPIAYETYLKDATLTTAVDRAKTRTHPGGKLYIAELKIISEA
jgi:hypothetical protein